LVFDWAFALIRKQAIGHDHCVIVLLGPFLRNSGCWVIIVPKRTILFLTLPFFLCFVSKHFVPGNGIGGAVVGGLWRSESLLTTVFRYHEYRELEVTVGTF